MTSSSRAHVSIGEVLAALKSDFPDVSVSKIRFLEGEGLVRPERTPSGYRKFGPADVERLRIILTMQRDSFLPLKVIRERLAALDAGLMPPEDGSAVASVRRESAYVPDDSNRPPPAEAVDLLRPPPAVHLTQSDLATASGLDVKDVQSLREFGVLCEHQANGATYFDGDDLEVARIARDFLRLGLEARHLRTLRRFAEQEANLFEQLVVPALRNRRPEARDQARGRLVELTKLSRSLHQAYVSQSLRPTLDEEA
ncbi:MAG: MerR family transcriptional regulator [Actinomycetota bacterium]